MAHGHQSSNTISQGEIPAPQTKWIWNTFWILLGITSFEFLIAFTKGPLHLNHYLVVFIFVVLTLVKAFYIVADFMHLKHEVKNLIMTIIVPLLLFVWFIGAFLWDGSSFRNLRNNYNPYFKEQSTIK